MHARNEADLLNGWLAEGRTLGCIDINLRKRIHTRFRCGRDFIIKPAVPGSFAEELARGHNISSAGMGIISRRPIPCNYEVLIQDGAANSNSPTLTASVIHCTQTIGGYKVGLQLRLA